MWHIQTQRLLLRNFVPSDWPALQRIVKQYMASPMGAYDHPWSTSDQNIKAYCEWFASTDAYIAVRALESYRLIGYLCMNNAEETPDEYELGYCFGADYHGKGYAYEACMAALGDVFTMRNATCVRAGTAAVNESSRRLLRRLGMEQTGEGMVSFAMDEQGNPIEFLGCAYEMDINRWQAVNA